MTRLKAEDALALFGDNQTSEPSTHGSASSGSLLRSMLIATVTKCRHTTTTDVNMLAEYH